MTKRLTVLLLVLTVVVGMLVMPGCTPSEVTLRITDNIPDRNSPWGKVIEEINAQFMKEHPNVKIVTESYPDQPYQEKMKIYAASNNLPDVFKYWSFSTLLGELVKSKMAMELKEKDFANLNWIPGSLESNMYDGKLYGLPVTTDFWVVYYNKALFEKYGVEVPATIDELMAAAKVFQANGIIPMTTDGKDGWPLSITYDNLIGRINGDFSVIQKALDREMRFTEPVFLEAAKKFKEMFDGKLFQNDLLTSDYGAARNLFGQEKAAMFLMGSWEMGLGTDTAFSEHFRNNVSVFKFPALAGSNGTVDDLEAWFGGNYVVSATTKHKKLCLDYLKLYFSLYPKLIWNTKANVPAQKIDANPDDNQLSKDLLAIVGDARQTSGTPTIDRSTPEFKELHMKYTQELLAGIKTPEQYVQALDEAAAEAANK